MIRNFKFLTDNDDNSELEFGGFVHDLHDGFASWMWAHNDPNRNPNWVVDEMNTISIRSFLMCFPEQMIVPIISITGDNITMTIANDHDPWPFNILGRTTLTIVYLRWVPE